MNQERNLEIEETIRDDIKGQAVVGTRQNLWDMLKKLTGEERTLELRQCWYKWSRRCRVDMFKPADDDEWRCEWKSMTSRRQLQVGIESNMRTEVNADKVRAAPDDDRVRLVNFVKFATGKFGNWKVNCDETKTDQWKVKVKTKHWQQTWFAITEGAKGVLAFDHHLHRVERRHNRRHQHSGVSWISYRGIGSAKPNQIKTINQRSRQ